MFVVRSATRRLVAVAVPRCSKQLTVYHRSGDVEKLLIIMKELKSLRIVNDLNYTGPAVQTVQKPVLTQIVIKQILDILNSKDIGFEICTLLEQIMKEMIRHEMYHETSFDLLARTLRTTTNELLMRHVVPAFLGMCSKVRYYDPSLTNIAGCYAMDNMNGLNEPQLVSVIYSMAKFYHPFPTLFSKLEKYLLTDNIYLNARHLAWMLVWGGMIHADYPKDLMSLMLQDSYIQGNLMYDVKFVLMVLLQLKISLNTECLDLKLGTGWDSVGNLQSWGACRSGIKGVSSEVMRLAYVMRISEYFKMSVFNSNILRSLQCYVNDSECIRTESLSLTGYCFDFEILLNSNGNPIPTPLLKKSKSNIDLMTSIGAEKDLQLVEQLFKSEAMLLDKRINFKKESENHLSSSRNFCHTHSVNIASDWEYKFGSYPPNVSRKIVIEGNGPTHYACNCRHSMGPTRLKKRHLESLGWELISIDYKKWMKFRTGLDEVAHLRSLINPNLPKKFIID